VALARALVVEPTLLLLDEPLSNLDVALRLSTREELRQLQRAVGITTIYVTHDQSEALALSDRLAVMRAGRLEQVGSPTEVFDRPATPFVAGFLGGANMLSREEVHALGGLPGCDPGTGGVVAVKPESVTLCARGTPDSLEGRVLGREFQGYLTELRLLVRGRSLLALLPSASVPSDVIPGRDTGLRIDWLRSTVFRDGGQ
jgi:ABC-type Fe3+/spermidine/putrescine transport system ATPase subunit